jgi:hypothetical protein
MQINIPEVLAEATEIFQKYECALVENDVALLNTLFWDSPFTLRYGTGEIQYGCDAIRTYRKTCTPVAPSRILQHTVITTFGRDVATANTEFLPAPGAERLGRQSQTWVRMPDGWRIVDAHVSWHDPSPNNSSNIELSDSSIRRSP